MMMDTHFKPHHLTATPEDLQGNGAFGRYVFLPGSDGRARAIADRFNQVEVRESSRGHNFYMGTLDAGGIKCEVAAVASGMGCPSLDIIVTELIHLGARRLLRVGTAGSLQPKHIRTPSVVIATGAVRDEGASRLYAPLEVPAMASITMIEVLTAAAEKLGYTENVFRGPVHSKDSLFAREFGQGPAAGENRRYMEHLTDLGVLASEMEASHLFMLGQVHGFEVPSIGSKSVGRILTGCILAIIGDDRPFAPPEEAEQAIQQTIDIALEGTRVLALREHPRTAPLLD